MSDRVRVVMRRGLWRWECPCGRKGRRGYGFPGLAELYGRKHAEAKHG